MNMDALNDSIMACECHSCKVMFVRVGMYKLNCRKL